MNAPAPTRTGVQLKGFPGAGLTASSTITVWYWVGLGLGFSSLPPLVLEKLAAFAPGYGLGATTPTARACCMRERREEQIMFVCSQILKAVICLTSKPFNPIRMRISTLEDAGVACVWQASRPTGGWRLARLLSSPHSIPEVYVLNRSAVISSQCCCVFEKVSGLLVGCARCPRRPRVQCCA